MKKINNSIWTFVGKTAHQSIINPVRDFVWRQSVYRKGNRVYNATCNTVGLSLNFPKIGIKRAVINQLNQL